MDLPPAHNAVTGKEGWILWVLVIQVEGPAQDLLSSQMLSNNPVFLNNKIFMSLTIYLPIGFQSVRQSVSALENIIFAFDMNDWVHKIYFKFEIGPMRLLRSELISDI